MSESLRLVHSAPVRPLPIRQVPVQGEAFASFVHRLAAQYDVSLQTMLEHVGLVRTGSPLTIPSFGIHLDDDCLDRFCRATRLSEDVIRSTLLSHYDGLAIDFSTFVPGDPRSLRAIAMTQWAYFWGSHFCPECLAEDDGAWRLAWKLPWSFACVRHEALLVDTCPSCGLRAGNGRSDRSLTPVFMSQVPLAGCCGHARPQVPVAKGRAAIRCDFGLFGARSVDLAGAPRVLDSQQRINTMLARAGTPDAESKAAVRTYFAELRSLAALTLFCGSVDDLGELSTELQAAFSSHASERDSLIEARRHLSDRRKGARTRVFVDAPQSAGVMAALLPLAISVLDAESDEEAAELVRPLATRLAGRRTSRWVVLQQFGFTERLSSIFSTALAESLKFDRAAGVRWHAGQLAEGATYAFESRYVPQLLAKDDFYRNFAKLLPGIQPAFARRYCAMALLRLSRRCTWAEAAESLELPVGPGEGMANRAVGVLRQAGTYEQFARELHRAAAALAEQPRRKDFGQLRQTLAKFTDIKTEDWERICRSAGVNMGASGSRSRYAAAWLWAELTGGDWTLAPGLAGGNRRNQYMAFYRLEQSVFPKLAPALLEYGTHLVQAAGRRDVT